MNLMVLNGARFICPLKGMTKKTSAIQGGAQAARVYGTLKHAMESVYNRGEKLRSIRSSNEASCMIQIY